MQKRFVSALRISRRSERGVAMRLCRRLFTGKSYPADTMMVLRSADKECFVVGTAHVSKESALQVRDVIEQVRPDVVVVELCAARAASLARKMERPNVPPSAFEFIKQIMGASGALHVVLSMVYRLFEQLGSEPGAEFKTAIEVCKAKGIPVVNGDQDIDVTMSRLKNVLTLSRVLQYLTAKTPELTPEEKELAHQKLGGDSVEMVERMKSRKHVRTLMSISRKIMPDFVTVILDERDVILCESIRNAKGKRVVAVVGLAHMEGIERHWKSRM